jgi:hypothetical protein
VTRLAECHERFALAVMATHHVTNTAFSRIGRGYRAAWHPWRTLFRAWPAPLMPTSQAIVRPAADRSSRNEYAGYTVSKSNERS